MNAALATSASRPPVRRRQRRRLVSMYLAGLGTVLVVSVAGVFQRSTGPGPAVMMALFLMAILLTVYSSFRLSRPALLGLPEGHADPDERQRERLAQATALSYRILSGALVVALLAFTFAGDDLLTRLKASQAGARAAFALLWLIPFLPMLCWPGRNRTFPTDLPVPQTPPRRNLLRKPLERELP